jgi:hypothetical protein
MIEKRDDVEHRNHSIAFAHRMKMKNVSTKGVRCSPTCGQRSAEQFRRGQTARGPRAFMKPVGTGRPDFRKRLDRGGNDKNDSRDEPQHEDVLRHGQVNAENRRQVDEG